MLFFNGKELKLGQGRPIQNCCGADRAEGGMRGARGGSREEEEEEGGRVKRVDERGWGVYKNSIFWCILFSVTREFLNSDFRVLTS